MTRRKDRQQQYLSPNAGLGMLSLDLVQSAHLLLHAALHDRRREVVRLPQNHYSPRAAGAVALTVTAFDVSMSEIAATAAVFCNEQTKEFALESTRRKFELLAANAEAAKPLAEEVGMLVDLRDEIVHYLPRQVTGVGNVPPWFRTLHEREMFILAPNGDFQFTQKIPSYALAYWAWSVSYQALETIVSMLSPAAQSVCDLYASNFQLPRSICPPVALPEFDAHYGLSLTTFEDHGADLPS